MSGWPSTNIHCVELKLFHTQIPLWHFDFLSSKFLELVLCSYLKYCQKNRKPVPRTWSCMLSLRGELEVPAQLRPGKCPTSHADQSFYWWVEETGLEIYGIYPGVHSELLTDEVSVMGLLFILKSRAPPTVPCGPYSGIFCFLRHPSFRAATFLSLVSPPPQLLPPGIQTDFCPLSACSLS